MKEAGKAVSTYNDWEPSELRLSEGRFLTSSLKMQKNEYLGDNIKTSFFLPGHF